MKLVYLAHPVSGDTPANLESAAQWVRWASRLSGVVPLAPYFQSVAAFSELNPSEREEGFQHGLKVLRSCQELWVCGEKITDGMRREIYCAQGWQIPVVYFDEMKIKKRRAVL